MLSIVRADTPREVDISNIPTEDEIPIFKLWFNSTLNENRTLSEKKKNVKFREPNEDEIEKAKRWWSLKKNIEGEDSKKSMEIELNKIKEKLKTESLRVKLIEEDLKLGPGITYNPLFDHNKLTPLGKRRKHKRTIRKHTTHKKRKRKRTVRKHGTHKQRKHKLTKRKHKKKI